MKNIKKDILDYLLITIGCLIMAIGVALILLPNELSTGGFTGIALVFYYFLNIKVGTVIIILNIPLLVWLYLKLGRNIFIKNVYGIGALSLFINIFETYSPITEDKFLACIYRWCLFGDRNCLGFKRKWVNRWIRFIF